MENISKLCGEILPLTETIDWIEDNKKMTTPFVERIGEKKTWIIDKHHNSNIP